MSTPVVVIGFVLLIPSVLGMLLSFMLFMSVMNTSSASHDSSAATGIAGGIVIFMGVGCMVGGLLGWLLIMKKKVLQCGTCGAVVNAS